VSTAATAHAPSDGELLPALERLRDRRPDLHLEYPIAERWLARGERAAARAICEEGLRAKPGYYQLHLTLGKIAELDGRSDDAIIAYRAVVTACPANLYATRRLLELAPTELTTPSERRTTPGEDPFVNPTMAQLYASQGHTGRAIAIYRTLLHRHPGDPALLARLAALEQE